MKADEKNTIKEWLKEPLDESEIIMAKSKVKTLHPLENVPISNLFWVTYSLKRFKDWASDKF